MCKVRTAGIERYRQYNNYRAIWRKTPGGQKGGKHHRPGKSPLIDHGLNLHHSFLSLFLPLLSSSRSLSFIYPPLFDRVVLVSWFRRELWPLAVPFLFPYLCPEFPSPQKVVLSILSLLCLWSGAFYFCGGIASSQSGFLIPGYLTCP